MPNTYDIGTGFAAGIQQGLQIGVQKGIREQMRQQELADRAQAQALLQQHRAEQAALDARRYAATNPEAALAEVAAFRQLGPLPENAAMMGEIATPLAFRAYQDRETAAADKALLMQQMQADRAMQNRERQARIAAINADLAQRKREGMARTLGTAAGSFLDNSALGQTASALMRNYRAGAVARPQMDTIEETMTDENGKQTKITRRVPAGTTPTAAASPTGAMPPGSDPRALGFAEALAKASSAGTAETEAAKKKLAAEKKRLEEERVRNQMQNWDFAPQGAFN